MKEKTFHLTRLTDKKLSNVRSAKKNYFSRILRILPSPLFPGKNIDENENENENEKDTENLTISVDAKSVIEVNTATDDSKEKNHIYTKL